MNTSLVYFVLDNIRSLHNVGAILRSASFFGFSNVILLGISGKEPNLYTGNWKINQELTKTALGAEQDLEIIQMNGNEELLDFINHENLQLICVEQDQRSISLKDWKPTEKIAVVFGHERNGVNRELLEKAEKIVEIPRQGIHDSLNVATTCGIVLNHIVTR